MPLQTEHVASFIPDGGGAHEGPRADLAQLCPGGLLLDLQLAFPGNLQDQYPSPHIYVLQQDPRTQPLPIAAP